MDLDSLRSTHPIDVPVKSPAQIREIFDPISYDKGGCTLRMLEQYVGPGPFRRGLVDYLTRFKHGNARGADLWKCIERASGKPVSKMMKSWIAAPGFPVVHLMQRSKDKLSARQERYAPGRRHARSSGPWPIPLSIRLDGCKNTKTVMFSSRSVSVDVPSARGKRVVVANPGRTGFYRVKYDDSMLLDMRMLADAGRLDPPDLWALQNDLFAMCVSGEARVRDYLDILDAYRDVTDYAVLADVGLNLSRLYLLSSDGSMPPAAGEIGAYSAEFYGRVYAKVTGWTPKKNEPHTISLLRGPVVLSLGRLGDRGIVARCRDSYSRLSDSDGSVAPHVLPPDMIDPVCTVAAWSSPSKRAALGVRNSLVAMYRKADTTEQKVRFLGAMCGFRHPALLARALEFALSSEVRSQNLFAPVLRVAENPYGRDILWPWIQKNWSRISKKVGQGNPLLGRVVSSLANTCTPLEIPAMRRFFAENPAPGTERTLLQTLERIRIAHAMRIRMQKEFGATAQKRGA